MSRLCTLVVFVCGLILHGGCCYFRDTCGSGYDPYSVNGVTVAPVSVWLDNQKAEWGGTGYRINRSIDRTPMFRYVIDRPEVLGAVREVSISIFREREGRFPDAADYVVSARETALSQGGVPSKKTVRLGIPGEGLRIVDARGQDVDTLTLDPHTRYLMSFVVSGERSASMRIEFRTR